jgi:hypothetical protein
MPLCGAMDPLPMPALLLGGALGAVLPGARPRTHRRGETGFAQVRLELAAGAMAQAEQLLREWEAHPIDEATLIHKATERACGTCPSRKGCKEQDVLNGLSSSLLHQPQIHMDDLPVDCKKRNRMLPKLFNCTGSAKDFDERIIAL